MLVPPAILPDNLLCFSALGAGLADNVCSTCRQTDRRTARPRKSCSQSYSSKRAKGPRGRGGVGHELETRGKAHMGKSQEPSPHGAQRPPRQRVHGFLVEFWGNLGGTGSPKPRRPLGHSRTSR